MNKFCVYLHIDNNGDIFYVGQGTHGRAHSTTALGRAARWYEISKEGFDVIIAYDGLSKEKVKQAWLLVKECKLTNKEISEITSIEVSQVSRIRHRKTLVKWLDEFEEELAKQ